MWPEGLAHYSEVHRVRLPAEFVAHVIARMDDIDAAERDRSWWLASALQVVPPRPSRGSAGARP